jgi:hypothetical protein
MFPSHILCNYHPSQLFACFVHVQSHIPCRRPYLYSFFPAHSLSFCVDFHVLALSVFIFKCYLFLWGCLCLPQDVLDTVIHVVAFRFLQLYSYCLVVCRMFREGAEWAKPGPFCGEGQSKRALSGGV